MMLLKHLKNVLLPLLLILITGCCGSDDIPFCAEETTASGQIECEMCWDSYECFNDWVKDKTGANHRDIIDQFDLCEVINL